MDKQGDIEGLNGKTIRSITLHTGPNKGDGVLFIVTCTDDTRLELRGNGPVQIDVHLYQHA